MNLSNRIDIDFRNAIMFQVIYYRIPRYMQDRDGFVFAIPFKINPSEFYIRIKARVVYQIISNLFEKLPVIIDKYRVEQRIRERLFYFFNIIPVGRFLFEFVELVNWLVWAGGKEHEGGDGGHEQGEAFHRAIGLRVKIQS